MRSGDIPTGWTVLTREAVEPGDKYWSHRLWAWMPVIVGDARIGKRADLLMHAVIRKQERNG